MKHGGLSDDALLGLPLFADTPPADVRELRRLSESVAFRPGQVVFEQGEAMKAEALLVVGGRLRVSVESGGVRRDLADVVPGEFVGEAGLFTGGIGRSARVVAVEASSGLRITRELLVSQAGHPALVALEQALIALMVKRIRETHATLEEVLSEAQSGIRPAQDRTRVSVPHEPRQSLAQRLARWFQGRA